MKRLLKLTFKYFIGPLLVLIVLGLVGLIGYYHFLYTPPSFQLSTDIAQPEFEQTFESDDPILLPVPKKATYTTGYFSIPEKVQIRAEASDVSSLIKIWENRMNTVAAPHPQGKIVFEKKTELSSQGYRLKISAGGIKVEYSSLAGAFYAITTLKQLVLQSSHGIPAQEIEDHPDLKTRGALVDISRGKVPKLETLYTLVDLLADLKYNQLQLYIEGFSFGYPSFSKYWEGTENQLMPREIQLLDKYCQDRFIELVPNQNSLGHMEAWLKQDDLKDLAECPEGYKLLGLIEVKTTLSPTDPRSFELVKQMSEDLLPNFSSSQFNVNLDEPFELGKSKERPVEDPREIDRLYLEYARKLNTYVTGKNKKMMMWGDVVSRSPEVIAEIPRDITLLEWRYEAFQPFDEICKRYQTAGLRYMVCPGTSTWSSYTGRTDNMLKNVSDAIENGVKYSADGMLITDWGNTPHLQYLTVSYPGLIYGGGLSWNVESKKNIPLHSYLSKVVLADTSGMMGNLMLNLGRYCQFEEYPMMAMTTSNFAMQLGMMDPVMFNAIQARMLRGIFELGVLDTTSMANLQVMFENPKPYQAEAALQYVTALDDQLDSLRIGGTNAELIKDEYKNNIRMVKLAIKLKQYILYHLEQGDTENRESLTTMKSLCNTIILEHERLWMQRNKPGGFKESIEGFLKLQKDIDRQLEIIDGNNLSRWTNRTFEKVVSAATALYLN